MAAGGCISPTNPLHTHPRPDDTDTAYMVGCLTDPGQIISWGGIEYHGRVGGLAHFCRIGVMDAPCPVQNPEPVGVLLPDRIARGDVLLGQNRLDDVVGALVEATDNVDTRFVSHLCKSDKEPRVGQGCDSTAPKVCTMYIVLGVEMMTVLCKYVRAVDGRG